LLHAVRLRDVLRGGHDDPRAFVEAFHEKTEAEVAPWYHAQIAADRTRFAQIEAMRDGREAPPPADELSRFLSSLRVAMVADPDLFRAALEYIATITPIQEILKRPEVAKGVAATMEALGSSAGVSMPGPDRKQLLELVA